MLDNFNVTNQDKGVRIYYASGSSAWQTWSKPRNCRQVYIVCIGGASSGFSATDINIGGRGGASAAITNALYNADVIPDTLYVLPGLGGLPNSTAVNSFNPGTRSFVSLKPSSATAMNLICTSGSAAASGATGETATNIFSVPLLKSAYWSSTAGVAPPSVGIGITGDVIPLVGSILCPGASGASSTSTPGGSILSVTLGTFLTPVIGGSYGNGDDGIWFWSPSPFGLGGSGGAGFQEVGTGGNGGNGAYGCGGGGAGNGTGPGGVVATGGKGGDGLVIIVSI